MEVSCQHLVLSPSRMETDRVARRKDSRTGLDVVSEKAVPPFRYLKIPAVHVKVNHVRDTAHAHGRYSLLTQQTYLWLMKSYNTLLVIHPVTRHIALCFGY